MDLWKQNLLTCASAAVVAFEILSVWSCALGETMVSLLETVSKIVSGTPRTDVVTLRWLSELENITWSYRYCLLRRCTFYSVTFFFLWLYSPILGHGRLHETFRFISVTRSRRVSRTPWTGDQLVARHLLTGPGDCDDDGEDGGMNGFGRGNRSTRRNPAPTPLCPPHIPDSGANPGRRGRKPATNRFSYGAAMYIYSTF
jgi:hypothetical protein